MLRSADDYLFVVVDAVLNIALPFQQKRLSLRMVYVR